MTNIIVSAIVAAAKNNAIGKDNKLLWHIPADLKFFKKTTMGKPMIMGRKTYESFGKPLPGRPHIVVSRSPGEAVNEHGPFFFTDIGEAIADAKRRAQDLGVDEIMIIGGGEIYAQTLKQTDRIYLTRVEKEYDAAVFFPNLAPHEWHTESKEEHHDNEPPFTFYVLERKT